MKLRNALPEDFDFVLKLTRGNMERIVTKEWNADWEKDVEPNFVDLWKNNVHARQFFAKNKFEFVEETESGILVERRILV